MKMNMGRFILKFFLAIIACTGMKAQSLLPVLDTQVHANQVYLDPLNNVYLIDEVQHQLRKYNPAFQLLAQTDIDRGWDQAQLDVTDPFKILLFAPGEYRIHVLDANLAKLSSFDDPDLNQQASLCYLSSEEIALFDGRTLKIKNPYSGKELTGAQLAQFPPTDKPGKPAKLIRHRDAIYLFRPGLGIFRFTSQLFEDRSWPDADMAYMDLSGDQILSLDVKNQLRWHEPVGWSYKALYQTSSPVRSLASNARFIALIEGDHLKIFQIRD